MATGPTLPPQAYTREILTAAFNWLQSQPESVRKLATSPDALVGLYMRAQRYGSSSFEADAPVSSQNFMSDLKSLAEGLKQFEDPNERKMNTPSRQASMPHAQYSANAHGAFPNGTAPQANSTPQANLGQLHANDFSQAPRAQMRMPQNSQASAPMAASANSFSAPPSAQSAHAPNNAHSSAHANAPSNAQFSPQMHTQIAMELANSVQNGAAHMAHASHGQFPADFGMNMSGNAFGALNGRSLQMIQEVKSTLNLSSDEEAVNMMIALAYKNLKNLLA